MWYNSEISKNPLFFPDWFKKGTYMVSDLMNTNGKILNIEELRTKYKFNPNILNYFTLKVKTFLSKHRFSKNCTIQEPSYPIHLKILFSSKRGCNKFYETYKKRDFENHSPL